VLQYGSATNRIYQLNKAIVVRALPPEIQAMGGKGGRTGQNRRSMHGA